MSQTTLPSTAAGLEPHDRQTPPRRSRQLALLHFFMAARGVDRQSNPLQPAEVIPVV